MIDSLFLKQAATLPTAGTPNSDVTARGTGQANATLNIMAGKMTLKVAGHQLQLQPGKTHLAAAPVGKVWVARASDQTAVILNAFSNRPDTTLALKQTPSAIAALTFKHAAQVLPDQMRLPTVITRESDGEIKLSIARTTVALAIPSRLSGGALSEGKYSAAIDIKQSKLVVTNQQKPVMAIPLNKTQFNQLVKTAASHELQTTGLRLSGIPDALRQALQLPPETNTAASAQLKAHGSAVSLVTSHNHPWAKISAPYSVLSKLPPLPAQLIKETASVPIMPSQLVPPSDNAASPSPATQSPDVHATIKELAKNLLAHTGSTNQALKQLVGILQQTQLTGTTQPSFKVIFDAIAGQPAGDVSESRKVLTPTKDQVISLIQNATQPITPAVMNRPVTADSLSNGLVALFQLILAGRSSAKPAADLLRAANHTDHVFDKPADTAAPAAKPRANTELTSLEKQSGLLQPIKTLLANHQSAVLSNVEARNQGLDQLYFCLPVRSDFINRESEVLIKREESGDETNQHADTADRKWSLSMKLDIGDNGELLAKSKITKNTISLDLYASNLVLLESVNRTLPLLTERLASLGVEVTATSAQQGKIPENLRTSPYQLFEVTV